MGGQSDLPSCSGLYFCLILSYYHLPWKLQICINWFSYICSWASCFSNSWIGPSHSHTFLFAYILSFQPFVDVWSSSLLQHFLVKLIFLFISFLHSSSNQITFPENLIPALLLLLLPVCIFLSLIIVSVASSHTLLTLFCLQSRVHVYRDYTKLGNRNFWISTDTKISLTGCSWIMKMKQ